MLFRSTRGQDCHKTFEEVLLAGLASDGGLFIPEKWPQVDLKAIKKCKSFVEIAHHIVPLFTDSSYTQEEVKEIVESTWHDFKSKNLIDIHNFDNNVFVAELFHGPTAAFKDFGLQLCAAFFNTALKKKKKTAIVLGATSGDTGSAAIDACKHYDSIKTFILLPKGNMTEIQRRQMTTVDQSNVCVIDIDGTFDECQDIVKYAFQSKQFLRPNQELLAVNSINWVRIIGQICYYFFIAMKINQLSKPLNFSIPTGNFGNVFACYSAYKMGLPINKILISVNKNDILHKFFDKNDYSKTSVHETLSPSMDITVASNFERLIFDFFLNSNPIKCKELFDNFPNSSISFSHNAWQNAKQLFHSVSISDDRTISIISKIYKDFDYLVDPHTAVGMAATSLFTDVNLGTTVVLATAHPGKFPDTMKLSGISNIPTHHKLSGLLEKKEKSVSLEANKDKVLRFIADNNL